MGTIKVNRLLRLRIQGSKNQKSGKWWKMWFASPLHLWFSSLRINLWLPCNLQSTRQVSLTQSMKIFKKSHFRLMDWAHTPYQSFMPHWSFRHNLRQVWWSNMPVRNGPWLDACFVIPFTLVLNFIQPFILFYQQRRFWELLQHLYGSLNVITWQRWGIQLRPMSHSVGFCPKYGHFCPTFRDKIDESFLRFFSLTLILLDLILLLKV